jgi:hypothetical protein
MTFEELLMKVIDPEASQYKALGRELRHIVVDELKKTNFSHLKNPGTKTKQYGPLQDTRFRFNVLPRFPSRTGNGVRHLSIGDDEIILCFYGLFNDFHDYTKGVDFVDGFPPYRFVFGRCLACDELCDAVSYVFESNWEQEQELLSQGRYKDFVQVALPTINNNIAILKMLVNDNDYCPKN